MVIVSKTNSDMSIIDHEQMTVKYVSSFGNCPTYLKSILEKLSGYIVHAQISKHEDVHGYLTFRK